MTDVLDILLKFIATIGVLIGGLWALTKYVIERGLVPAAELDLDCNVIGGKEQQKIIEVTVHILNKGASVLVANNIRVILKTICPEDRLSLYKDERKLGRLDFPLHSISKELTKEMINRDEGSFTLVPFDTFVQPGVDQKYSFVTTINIDAEFLHAHAEFQYAQRPTGLQKKLLKLSRRIGLMQYSLDHIYMPHTIQRAFNLTASTYAPDKVDSSS